MTPTTLSEARELAAQALAPDAPAYEVLAIRYGTRMTTRGACYVDDGRLDDPDAPLGMDYFFWLLRGDAGTILVDTGFDPAVGERRGRTTLVTPAEALDRLGVSTEQIHLLVLTHLHYDHSGNVRTVPEAELLVQERDLEFWEGPGSEGEHAVHVEPDELREVGEHDLTLLDGGAIVAPGVAAILVGGHSPGQQALVVNGVERPVLLASDAVHYYEELERRLPFAIYVDLDEMRAGYELLAALARETGAVLVPGHDPAVAERFPPLSRELAGIAVRLA